MAVTIDRAPEVMRHDVPARGSRTTRHIGLFACGVAASWLYVAANVFGAVRWEGCGRHEGARIAANEPTPWHGVYERINVGGYLLWMAVLAIVLIRTGAHSHLQRDG